ncbi:MAG: DUF4843 domain-containing protein [Odoribacteraceae bacterium]|jgi:hypothetical protein|nr:DUF4843 domain-containing protein [Odoribacteraceae bacterium]
MKKYITILAAALFLAACEEDKLPLFSGEPVVYFESQSVSFGFGLLTVMDSTVRVPVLATGNLVDRDRHFAIAYDTIQGTPGTHFDPLPAEGILPANSHRGYVYVNLHRLMTDDSTYHIAMRLLPNDEFSINLPELFTGATPFDATTALLSYTSTIAKPLGWQEMVYGYFSVAKYFAASEATGRGPDFWSTGASQVSMMLSPIIANYVNSRILAGRDHALRDPGNTDPADKGFMTMRGINSYYGQYVKIPDDWAPAE